jgi:colanic acid/amylovoran biosynthesis glycosyltransferase
MSNIAILSPNNNAYSETFIQAHKALNGGACKYFYGNKGKIGLEGQGVLQMPSARRLYYKILGKALNSPHLDVEALLLNAFKKLKIKAVLVEYGTTAADFLPVLKKSRLPFVVHFHGYDASKKEVLEKCQVQYHEVFRMASKIVVVSKKMQEMVTSMGCPEHKIMYNVYGPDNAFFQVRTTFQEQVFIGVGRFVDKKAPYYTIAAFARVQASYPNARLILAGDGPLLETCRNIARSQGLNVVFPGVISPEDFRKHLSASMAFVQHSIVAGNGDMEGTPVAILEAGAAGIPVISTFHAGIPDVVVDGETGLLCQEHDVEKMAADMIYFVQNPGRAREMGCKARNRIKEHYTMQRHLDVLEEIFKKITKA